MSRAKRWCFTLNNYTNAEHLHLAGAIGDERLGIEYLIYGKETGESGTPHLQGFVIFKAAVRLSTAKSRLALGRAHLEVARGSPQQASEYCKKDGDYEEYGELPEVTQGRRTDLDSFFQWADEFCNDNGRPPTYEDAAVEHPGIITKFPRALAVAEARCARPKISTGEPREWQVDLKDELLEPPDDRSVTFVVDEEGGKGKSWFVRYWLDNHRDTQFMSVGKRDDLAHIVEPQTKYFLFDVPRGQMEFFQYSIVEQLKNRLVFSPKYLSRTKTLYKMPHVVVFSNEMPDFEKLTHDRFNIKRI